MMAIEAVGVCELVVVGVAVRVGVPDMEAVLETEAPNVSEAVGELVLEAVAVRVGVGGAQPRRMTEPAPPWPVVGEPPT